MNKADLQQRHSEMTDMIRQWESSGKKQVQFLSERGLKPALFYYWLKKYRQSLSPAGFIPLQVVKGKKITKTPEAIIAIRYPNGTSIHLPCSTPVSMIRTLAGL
jgi:hypothetical protein